jgi:hypothetical protein
LGCYTLLNPSPDWPGIVYLLNHNGRVALKPPSK